MIVSFKTAKQAKAVGFNLPCVYYYGKYGKLHKSRQTITQKSLRGSSESCLAPSENQYKEWLKFNKQNKQS